MDEAGPQTMVVLGTYGLDEAGAWSGKQTAHAAQALAFVRADGSTKTAKVEPSFLTGLPLTPKGWIEGDVQVGGGGRGGFWLERVVRTPAALNKGALFEVARDGFTWSGDAWRPSAGRDSLQRGPHTMLPLASLFCGGEQSFSLLASERFVDGTTFAAGRCEDELHRPTGGLGLAKFDIRRREWQRLAAPNAALLDGPDAIVNAGIVPVSSDEAWVHAYRPFRETDREKPYLLHVVGSQTELIAAPFEKSIVSIARAPDGTLWTVAGFSSLHRRNNQSWEEVALPPLSFVDPVPSSIRLLEVQATNQGVWVHGAVPVERGREHVLFTTAPWSRTLNCDRNRDPSAALAVTGGAKVRLAQLPARKAVE